MRRSPAGDPPNSFSYQRFFTVLFGEYCDKSIGFADILTFEDDSLSLVRPNHKLTSTTLSAVKLNFTFCFPFTNIAYSCPTVPGCFWINIFSLFPLFLKGSLYLSVN